MKNKEFFYLQYDKLAWENQEKTKINTFVNNFIINKILLKRKEKSISIFDMGFGIGFFFKMLQKKLPSHFKEIFLTGCEPSKRNYNNLKLNPLKNKSINVKTFNTTFLKTQINKKFDFITSIYVFPHFESDALVNVAKKIHSMLNNNSKFILVVANETYIKAKLKAKKDLFIEKNIVKFAGKKYKEVLHYSEIPQIGTVIDYNREERFYIDLFEKNGFKLEKKKFLNDNGFICTIFIFEKI
jgi:2-polyprenyl-3-methyl-5-hydroxy-6-metoxy-1,4-benzoquinol methylase